MLRFRESFHFSRKPEKKTRFGVAARSLSVAFGHPFRSMYPPWGAQGRAKARHVDRAKDATKTLPKISESDFDIVFIDPPYGKGLGQKAMQSLKECKMLRTDTLIILEEGCEINAVEGFSIKDCRRYGSSYAHFLKLNIS